MAGHNVVRFVSGLSEKLGSRSRHVCMFLGAGTSRACGLPDVTGLSSHIAGSLTGKQRSAFQHLSEKRNLEQVLSRIRRIATLLEGTDDEVDGLGAQAASELDVEICRLIISQLDVERASIQPALHLAAWAARAEYHRPLEFFTVNYDLILETGLEAMGVAYFDGFVGTLRARFRGDLVDAEAAENGGSISALFVRLWKLHGSVHWTWDDKPAREVIRIGGSLPDHRPAAIYPSDAKYDESRRMPFVALQDRFRRALYEPESLVIIAGYSFGDQHLNELIFEAARRRPRSEVLAFCFDDIPVELSGVALTTPNLQALGRTEAIIGGVRAAWEKPSTIQEYVWENENFMLGDFAHLASFLARSSSAQGDLEVRLAKFLAAAGVAND